MTRGNQREVARERNRKRQHEKGVGPKNTMSGSEYQRVREQQAAIMQEKQRRGTAALLIPDATSSLRGIHSECNTRDTRMSARPQNRQRHWQRK
ncbi:hypothetical protein VTN96DRAFT_7203 [Rasamsonia emersonii]